MGSNLAIMYKLPSVHKKCKKKENLMSYLNAGKHSNVKLSVKYSNHKTLPFLDCNVTFDQDNLFTSILKKNENIHWPWH